MRSNKSGALIALAGLVVAVVLFVVLSGDNGGDEPETTTQAQTTTTTEQAAPSDENGSAKAEPKPNPKPKPAEPKLPTLKIRNGEPVGGPLEIEFKSGGRIEFLIDADAPDELHLHGYDEYIDVGPGKPTKVSVKANIEGIFELESHSTGVLLAKISVVPS